MGRYLSKSSQISTNSTRTLYTGFAISVLIALTRAGYLAISAPQILPPAMPKGKKKRRLHHIDAPAGSQRDVRLRHMGTSTRMPSYNLSTSSSSLTFVSPHLSSSTFLCPFFVVSESLLSLLRTDPPRSRSKSDLRHGMTLASQP